MSGFSFYAGIFGFCLGILGHEFLGFDLLISVWTLLLALAVALVWRKNRLSIFTPFILALCILFLFLSFGIVRTEFADWYGVSNFPDSEVNQEVSLTGVIVREVDRREKTQHLYISDGAEKFLVITDRFSDFSYGDEVVVKGILKQPEAFATDLGRTFNYPGYLKTQGVNLMFIYPEVDKLSTGNGNYVLATLLSFKQAFMSKIESLIAEPAVGLGEGLLLGVKRALGDELELIFRRTGIIHIVVLSGYNVSLVILFVMYILAYILPYRARLLVGMLAIVAFCLLVGLSATVLRAGLMASLILLARFTGRTNSVMRGLMLAGFLMLLINPYSLAYDVGFQLSFLATMALILLAKKIESICGFMPETLKLREFFVATLTTQLFVLPLLLYQIGEFSLVSLIVNVLVLPMVAPAMLLTFLTGMIGFVSLSLAWPFAWLAQLSLEYILAVARFFGGLPFAAYTVPTFPFWLVMLFYSLLAYVVWQLLRESAELDSVKKGEPPIRPDVNHWEIEDEISLLKKLKEKEMSPNDNKELPIFFR